MTRTEPKITCTLLVAIIGLLAASITLASNVTADNWQVGRYQTVTLQPTEQQIDLLSTIVERELPEQISTVGEAITLLLDGSGYRLLSAKLADPYRVMLFAIPLPEVQRTLGPVSLRQALQLLSGPGFRPVIDPTYRLVSFELETTIATSDVDVSCSQ